METRKTIRVGVIGTGRIGKIHAGNLATRIPGVELAAVADTNFEFRQRSGVKTKCKKYLWRLSQDT